MGGEEICRVVALSERELMYLHDFQAPSVVFRFDLFWKELYQRGHPPQSLLG